MPRRLTTPKKLSHEIPPALRSYLETGTRVRGDMLTFMLQGSPDRLREAWEDCRAPIMRDWLKAHPCTRPWAWWEAEAPRWTRKFDAWFDGTLPEPRQRIGGVGTEDFEVLAHVPGFDRGIPTGWVSQFEADYFNGRARDIHATPIGTEYHEGDFAGVAIDPTDPPSYEAEPVYLERFGLLSEAEKRYLGQHPELREPEVIMPDEDEDEATPNSGVELIVASA